MLALLRRDKKNLEVCRVMGAMGGSFVTFASKVREERKLKKRLLDPRLVEVNKTKERLLHT